MQARDDSDPIFYDVEASAAVGGFPISVGFAVVDVTDRSWTARQKFIRHDPWLDDLARWSADAQSVHRIGRDFLLAHGEPAHVVARWLNECLGGKTIFVDTGPTGWDSIWTDELFAAAGIERQFTFAHLNVAFADPRVDVARMDGMEPVAAKRAPHTHAADDDAAHLACWWLLCLRGEQSAE